MPTITPHLWFDTQAKEAAAFYTSVFPDSHVESSTTIHDTPSGSADIVTMKLMGQDFTAISAGPLFKFTPAISFLINCTTKEAVEQLWNKLSDGGSPLMELGSYPFSEKYGWLKDKYGLSWQLMFVGEREVKQAITPFLLFTGDQYGRAEEAIEFYVSLFHNAHLGNMLRYSANEAPDTAGKIKHAVFSLEGQEFAAIESAHKHDFTFNEATSFIINCDTQEEIDYYWGKLSADPKAEQCGWLKDKYGLSWQVVPTMMNKMLQEKDPAKLARVTQAFLKMKKFNIAKLKQAYEQE